MGAFVRPRRPVPKGLCALFAGRRSIFPPSSRVAGVQRRHDLVDARSMGRCPPRVVAADRGGRGADPVARRPGQHEHRAAARGGRRRRRRHRAPGWRRRWRRWSRPGPSTSSTPQPYYSLRISSSDDVETAVLLLVVGLAVGELAVRGRRARAVAGRGRRDLASLQGLGALVAEGEDADYVLLGTESELTHLLGLVDCRFEATHEDNKILPVIHRDGSVKWGPNAWETERWGLPTDGATIPVWSRGVPARPLRARRRRSPCPTPRTSSPRPWRWSTRRAPVARRPAPAHAPRPSRPGRRPDGDPRHRRGDGAEPPVVVHPLLRAAEISSRVRATKFHHMTIGSVERRPADQQRGRCRPQRPARPRRGPAPRKPRWPGSTRVPSIVDRPVQHHEGVLPVGVQGQGRAPGPQRQLGADEVRVPPGRRGGAVELPDEHGGRAAVQRAAWAARRGARRPRRRDGWPPAARSRAGSRAGRRGSCPVRSSEWETPCPAVMRLSWPARIGCSEPRLS